MAEAKFLQIHTLTSYPASLLNRDDAGFAKRMPFGGAIRTRVSSQCLKYHWRNFKGEHSLSNLEIPHSIRSRRTFSEKIVKPLTEEGFSEKLVTAVVICIRDLMLSDKKTPRNEVKKILKGDEKNGDEADTSQVTILGEPEINYICEMVRDILKKVNEKLPALGKAPNIELSDEQINTVVEIIEQINETDLRKNLKALHTASGLEAAMFGRMVTSDIMARGDAAVHVAHSFTTHAEESESDYFTAVDELMRESEEGELGSGHLNTTELASGLFYGYIVIDIPLLVSNIEGCKREEWLDVDRSIPAQVVENFIFLVSTVSPGAKLGSTAPYSYSEFVLAEAGNSQPRTLANAFRRPVGDDDMRDVLASSYNAIGEHVKQFDAMYGNQDERRLSAIGPVGEIVGKFNIKKTVPLIDLARWAGKKVSE